MKANFECYSTGKETREQEKSKVVLARKKKRHDVPPPSMFYLEAEGSWIQEIALCYTLTTSVLSCTTLHVEETRKKQNVEVKDGA